MSDPNQPSTTWRISRRGALKALAGAPALGAVRALAQDVAADPFAHGVASGDPLVDRVILWTRYGPGGAVAWEVARDADFSTIVARGEATAEAGHDFTVKVDATGLAAGSAYFYRFTAGGAVSPTGRTRTLPAGAVDQVRFAVASCANYPYGFFHAYRHMATRDDIDAVLHLGDYIYEYERGRYASPDIEAGGRVVAPAGEIVTLADYRARYATYRTDADLQAAHARHPFITVWDDHEAANDAWKAGAENHDPDGSEGAWEARRAAAIQAYREWLPVRDHGPGGGGNRIYRSFDFGGLARLIMLDTRLYGRDRQLSYEHDLAADADGRPDIAGFKATRLGDAARTMLGRDQEAWLKDMMAASKTSGQTWQVLGQQLVMGNLNIPTDGAALMEGEPKAAPERVKALLALGPFHLPVNLDAWGGYPPARDRLLADVLAAANNAVVLSGDSHNAWAFELKTGGTRAAVEFGTPGVTSPGLEAYIPAAPARVAQALIEASDELVWADTAHRGYLTLTLTPEAATADWWLFDDVATGEAAARLDRTIKVAATQGAGIGPLTTA